MGVGAGAPPGNGDEDVEEEVVLSEDERVEVQQDVAQRDQASQAHLRDRDGVGVRGGSAQCARVGGEAVTECGSERSGWYGDSVTRPLPAWTRPCASRTAKSTPGSLA